MRLDMGIETLFSVEFDFQPFEPVTRDYPGCEASVTITEIRLGDVDVIEWFSARELDTLRDAVMRRHTEDLRDAAESETGFLFPEIDE